MSLILIKETIVFYYYFPRGEPRLELGVHRLWNYVELFWNSSDNALSSIVYYLEMKVEVDVGVHDITQFVLFKQVL